MKKQQFLSLVRWSWNGADTLRKVLHLVVLLSIFSIIINAIFASTPKVPGSAALVIRPTGRLVEQLSGDPFSRSLAELTGDAEPQTLVSDIIEGLRSAKDDARVMVKRAGDAVIVIGLANHGAYSEGNSDIVLSQ